MERKDAINLLKKYNKEEFHIVHALTFEIESDKDWYTFYYTLEGENAAGERIKMGRGETVYLTTEVGGSFTGNYYAMFAMGNGSKSETAAKFRDFSYVEM